MQASKLHLCGIVTLLCVAFGTLSCKKEVQKEVVYDNVIYQLDTVPLYSSNAEKNKQKSPTQYISILYADLFNAKISNNELNDLTELYLAIGDKSMANELLLSHYLNDPSVVLPSNEAMRNDLDAFVEDIYIRFYLRTPTAYERYYLKTLIEEDPQISPEMIFTAIVLSNEYYYY